ncbi:MAG TPA: hypothetical protein VMZ29_04685 [Candidatus Bathyarchaeia archaeon]|nr:hypothetical protein [Candidatus Bathyarchaeia archaeon]
MFKKNQKKMNQYEIYISKIEQKYYPESLHQMKVFDDSERMRNDLSIMKNILWNNQFKTNDPLHPKLEYPMYNFFVSDAVRRGMLPQIFPQLTLNNSKIPQLQQEITSYLEKGERWSAILRYRIILDILFNEENFKGAFGVLIQLGENYRRINQCLPADNCFDLAINIGKDYGLDSSLAVDRKKENQEYLKNVFTKVHDEIMEKFRYADRYALSGKLNEAITYYANLIIESGNIRLWEWSIKASLNYASCLKAVGQTTKAIEILKAAIEITDMIYDVKGRMMLLSQITR